MTKLIEKETVERDYGFTGTNAIIEHNGELWLICDGFGGQDSLEGGCVRWKHGMAYRLQAGDTIVSLHAGEWNETTDHWTALVNGYDDDRPMMMVNGYAIESIAKKLGL